MELEKLRFYQLKKQNLIQKAPSNYYENILKNHIALHSTDYITPYLSLWARIRAFEPKTLFDDINRHRALRIRAFRGTVFVVHKDSLENILGSLRIFLESRLSEAKKMAEKLGLDLEAIGQETTKLLSGNRSLTSSEIKKELGLDVKGDPFTIVMRYLEFGGILVRTDHRYITDPVIRYGLMKDRFPDIFSTAYKTDVSLEEMMLKYITQFGPVCFDDICWWFPIKKTLAREKLEHVKSKLEIMNFNDREYYMKKNDFITFRDFRPFENRIPIVNFLPYEDHFPKAYFIRDWYISEQTAPMAFHVGKIDYGQLRPSIWLDGEIIGRWEMVWPDKSKSAVNIQITDISPGLKQPHRVRDLIENRRAELEQFVNEKLVPLMKK